MKKLTVGQKLAGAFGVVILISLLGSAISIINFLRLNEANGWNIHSYGVLRANDDMLASMVNMETGVRGYVISGDEKFLDPYRTGQSQFAKSYEVIHALTLDSISKCNTSDEVRCCDEEDVHAFERGRARDADDRASPPHQRES
ncbi:CHASE3 domain-containing protein, partial [Burkholderia gladioli]|uniref:CHASE3 domain-containing protein n=1 Tax=Burkholderia gladioli TaxID=28095 RepID=UPI0022D7580A